MQRSTYQQIVGCQYDEEAVKVLPELLPHEDGDRPQVGPHSDDRHDEEEGRKHSDPTLPVSFIVAF